MSNKIYTEEQGEYFKNNPNWHIQDSPWKASQVLKILSKNNVHPKTIAEIGCGAGEILNQLHKHLPDDTKFTGFDISKDAIAMAETRKKERLDFRLENLLEVKKSFDLLLMMDVFEHVDDYMGFLRAAKNKAKHTVFHIPLDLSAQALLRNKLIIDRNGLGHLHYFSKDTALATLEDCGYKILDYFYTAGSLDLPQYTFKSKAVQLPRKLLFKANKDFTAKLLGGFSLLVFAE